MEEEDKMVSFDVVSLFMRVPVSEALWVIEDLLANFYNKLRVRPWVPPSPVVANIYMQDFEQRVVKTAPLKPSLWLRYVDDTFVVWNHGDRKLQSSLSI